MNKEHVKRIITAITFLPLIVWVVLFSPFWAIVFLVIGISLLGQWEYLNMWHVTNKYLLFIAILAGTIFFILLTLGFPLLGLSVAFFLLSLSFIIIYGLQPDLASYLPILGFGLIYPPFLLGHALFFLSLSQGRILLLWTLFVVFASDTGAFYIGCRFGKHKLYPKVSPKKSWEGLLGGFLGAFLVALVLLPFLPKLALIPSLLLAPFITIIEQTGDFFESVLKRYNKIKDSGSILPGHGGILDRIDGLLFALPFSYYFWDWWLR